MDFSKIRTYVKRKLQSRAVLVISSSGLVAVCLIVGGLNSYLESKAFRRIVSEEAGRTIGADVEFGSFDWKGLSLTTESLDVTNHTILTKAHGGNLSLSVGLGQLLRGAWEVSNARIERLEVTLNPAKPTLEKSVSQLSKSSRKGKSTFWFPSEVEFQELEIDELAIRTPMAGGLANIDGIELSVGREKGSLQRDIQIKGGTIRLPFSSLPEVEIESALLKYKNQHVALTKMHATVFENGRMQGLGYWDLASSKFSIQGFASDLKCNEIFGEDWAKRITGDATSSFLIDSGSGACVASGELVISNGTLTALPIWDSLAVYADTKRFRMLNLTEAHTDWRIEKDTVTLSRLVLASGGLMRLEGTLVVRNQQLDGNFRLGVAANALAVLPGAESAVFTAGEREMMWTPLRITGTLEKPEEDLTSRLLAAAGLRILEQFPQTGVKMIEESIAVINHPINIEEGVNMIDQSRDVATKRVAGFVNGLLGGEPDDAKEK